MLILPNVAGDSNLILHRLGQQFAIQSFGSGSIPGPGRKGSLRGSECGTGSEGMDGAIGLAGIGGAFGVSIAGATGMVRSPDGIGVV